MNTNRRRWELNSDGIYIRSTASISFLSTESTGPKETKEKSTMIESIIQTDILESNKTCSRSANNTWLTCFAFTDLRSIESMNENVFHRSSYLYRASSWFIFFCHFLSLSFPLMFSFNFTFIKIQISIAWILSAVFFFSYNVCSKIDHEKASPQSTNRKDEEA